MHKKSPSELLRNSILSIELRQKEQELLLREQLHVTVRKLQVGEVLLNLVTNFISPNETQSGVVPSLTSILGHYLTPSNGGKNSNIITQLATTLIRNATTNFIAKNSETIRILGLYYIKKIKDKFLAE